MPRLVISVLFLVGACVGDTPPHTTADAAPETNVQLSGSVADLLTGATVPDAKVIANLGTEAFNATISGGSYSVIVAKNQTVSLIVSKEAYKTTTLYQVGIGEVDVSQGVTIISATATADAYTQANQTEDPNLATVFVKLVDDQGNPATGLDKASVALVSGENPVGIGPYLINDQGQVDPQLQTAALYNGNAWAVFLKVPVGDIQAKLTIENAEPVLYDITARLGEVSVVATGAKPEPGNKELTFDADVAPILYGASCGGCHLNDGGAPYAPTDKLTYAHIQEDNLVTVPPGDVAASPLLTNGLGIDHPATAWANNTNNAEYLLVKEWIEQGAKEN